jgi:hypothetical protein
VLAGICSADDNNWSHSGRHGSVTLGVSTLPQKWRSAFYVNRGFGATVIRPYATACGFSFGMRNEGGVTIETRLSDWRAVGADGTEIPLRSPESWEAEWERADVSQSARIAFHWAQFQSENIFEPGDWIMGMATLAAAPQPPFRLLASYRDSGGEHEIVIEQLNCARD